MCPVLCLLSGASNRHRIPHHSAQHRHKVKTVAVLIYRISNTFSVCSEHHLSSCDTFTAPVMLCTEDLHSGPALLWCGRYGPRTVSRPAGGDDTGRGAGVGRAALLATTAVFRWWRACRNTLSATPARTRPPGYCASPTFTARTRSSSVLGYIRY